MKVIADVGNSDYYVRRAIETLTNPTTEGVKMAISLLALAIVAERKELKDGTENQQSASESPQKQRRRKVVPRPEAPDQQPANHVGGSESGPSGQSDASGSGSGDQRAILGFKDYPITDLDLR